MNIGLRNLATFGAVESWSGYFEATDPSGHHKLDLGSPQANAAAAVPRGALTHDGVPHLFRTNPGGHSGALWTGESKLWLGYALSALAHDK